MLKSVVDNPRNRDPKMAFSILFSESSSLSLAVVIAKPS